MNTTFDVVVAGHICLDIIPDLSVFKQGDFLNALRPGSLVTMGPVKISLGGQVPNMGLALHILGIPTRLMGKIGDDLFGRAIFDIIRSYAPSMAEGMVVDKTVSSSYTFVINPPDMDRFFMHCPCANDTFDVDDVKYDQLECARLFHFGYPPIMRLMFNDNGHRLSEIYRRAKQAGVTTSLDMATPDPNSASGRADWLKILELTLPYTDIFLPSVEELLFMIKRDLFLEMMARGQNGDILPQITPPLLSDLSVHLHEMGAKIVGIKLGYRGMYLDTPQKSALEGMGRAQPAALDGWSDKKIWAPVFDVDVVGTTGSGDSTVAGFLSAVLRGMDAEEAITAATAVGGCNVEAADSLSGLRSWDETMKRVANGWQRKPLHLQASGWTFDEQKQLWYGR